MQDILRLSVTPVSARIARRGTTCLPRMRPLRATGPDDAVPDQPSADEMIQALLANDPEAQKQVGRVSDAARRVAELQMEQARLARALAEAQGSDAASSELRERRAEAAAAETIAAAEARAAELLLRAAELEAESAQAERDIAASTADLEEERLETAKAGAAAAIGGAAAAAPLVLTSAATPLTGLLSLGASGASAFLFGLVYRYALRKDLGNTQLKGGVVAAFGLVRGLAEAGTVLNDRGLSGDALGLAAAAMGQSMLLFAFASVALEAAFQRGLVQPFPIEKK